MLFRVYIKKTVILIGSIFLILIIDPNLAVAQTGNIWPPPRNIPIYHPETEPPFLIADQDRTVHAFSSQWIGEDNQQKAIVYNQWNPDTGWTVQVDIILPPLKQQARILGAYMDHAGMMHVAFFSGDETEANVYYSQAPAVQAGHAQVWTAPVMIGEQALVPENGTITGDGQGNLVIVYSGNRSQHGLYAVYSEDGGNTWTEPVPVFLTGDNQLWPYYLQMYMGEKGQLYAVWSVNDISNHGEAIYFSIFDFTSQQWSEPLTIAETRGFLGTQAPALVEYNNALFVMYYDGSTGKQYQRRSSDSGETWTQAVAPFPHVGLNGPVSFVVDSNDDLHIFWGQRITGGLGEADAHGMWHSVWNDQSKTWAPYEALVSGQKVLDLVGFTSFDPVTPHVVASQGNVILVVWMTDYGSKGNGVWYSYKSLNAPELPVVPIPTPAADSNPTPESTKITSQPNPTSTPKPVFTDEGGYITEEKPLSTILAAVIPVSVLIVGIIVLTRVFSYTRR